MKDVLDPELPFYKSFGLVNANANSIVRALVMCRILDQQKILIGERILRQEM